MQLLSSDHLLGFSLFYSYLYGCFFFFFSSRRRHTRCSRDWSSDVCSSDLAMSIPLHLSNGISFPERNLILFITFMVILLTLVIQGLTLPAVIRWLHVEDKDHRSEERRVGKECRSRWWRYQYRKKERRERVR